MKFSESHFHRILSVEKASGMKSHFISLATRPEAEIRIRDHIRFLMAHIPKRRPGLKVKHINLSIW